MVVKQITNVEFNEMVQAAAHNLKQNVEFINSLNVFPVPDGDTGTNMSMSFESGAKYVAKDDSNSVGDLAQSLAKGLLMGARGNSGVILSQIFRGFSKSVEGKKTLNVSDVTEAFLNSAKVAYGSVMKPTEGTILTVIKGIGQVAKDCNDTEDIAVLMDKCYESAEVALKSTTELLPVLKQVGVVDSGGQGLVFVIKAFADILNNRFDANNEPHQPNNHEMNEMIDASHEQGRESVQGKLDPNDIVYGYCTQVMVRIGKGKQVEHEFDYDFFYDYLSKLGDSLLVINDDEIVKVHVHTEFPGKVLSWAQKFGDLSNIKVDNMRMQQEDIIEQDDKPEPAADEAPKDVAIIAVTSGDGLGELFKNLGATDLIKGGQTMNPSTEDLLNAINGSNAKSVILLPNNGNIFMAAEAAAKVADVPTKIVHSKTLAQGMTAIISFNPEQTIDENCNVMEEMLDTVKSGELTNAVRDTTISNLSIKKDDFIGIVDGKIKVNGTDLIDTATNMVKSMLDEDSEIVTIIYGEQGNQDTANKIKAAVQQLDEDLEIEIHNGGQPVYPFLISVE
ncbi:DAK2 domain-containing protein [Apilactobacillus ozensis]|uniref:DAK2 domain-containing protein n=1 Tax=Apilactobacillus ozensis TaxID=866801 RepID=UPI00200B1C4F|nr:DAK2 domain-containing protein [Apilactobacillus ozensis]MCK8606559.1 DAK2 domain-containing protein [Apilactobacillus ozensis]